MDREVVDQKLESLRRCLLRIESKCPVDAAVLAADFDLQDIVALNLSRAVQLVSGVRNPRISGVTRKAGIAYAYSADKPFS